LADNEASVRQSNK